jgi:enoyl-[acyl-carrier protein] reductase III
MRLKGKLALVTGSSRGIGQAIALKLAEEGADIIVNFLRHKQGAEETASAVEKMGVSAHIIKANLVEPEKIDDMFETIASKWGRLDILVNNAASGVARPALDLDTRGWEWAMDINARAFLLCAQQAVKLMKKGGKIVSVSSLGSSFVLPDYVAVGVSKAALEALTRYLAIELAPKGICVNAVAASAVLTEAIKFFIKEQEGQTPYWQMTPAGRMVTPEDVANLVAFLCSEEAFMIRGRTIVVDGGTSIAPFSFTEKEANTG